MQPRSAKLNNERINVGVAESVQCNALQTRTTPGANPGPYSTLGGSYVTAKSAKGVPRRTVNGCSKKFQRMSVLYRYFAELMTSTLDMSDEALISLYNHESYGTALSPNNGFAVGKQYLNLQVTMWREDLRRGWIFKSDLYEDVAFPHWWLDSVLEGTYAGSTFAELVRECRQI